MLAISSVQSFQSTRNVAIVATALAAALGLSGCADKGKSATQVVAKVNKEELSVHQLNHLLQRQQGLRPEQLEPASRQMLERLIDQELALQKAEELKIDRDPAVVQAIAVARREIVSRAYLDRVSDTASRPTPNEVKKYFDETPALFKERRIYKLQELSIEANKDQVGALRAQLKTAKNATEYIEYLRSKEIRFSANPSVRPAEQLPLSMIETFAKMNDGDAILTPTPHGADVVFVVSSQFVPLDEAKAGPAIQQFLLNERKRELVEKDIKALREASKIEYVGKFAAASAPTAVASPATPATGASGAEADVLNKRTSGMK